MCGIIVTNYAKDILCKQLYQQKERGMQGAGYLSLRGKNLSAYKSHNIFDVISKVGEYQNIVFHHRYPTSTSNTTKTAHPFLTSDGMSLGVHNGVIHNPLNYMDTIQNPVIEWEDTGNDSQAIIEEIQKVIRTKENYQLTSRGLAAVVLVEKSTNHIYIFKNEQSLHMRVREDYYIIASVDPGEEYGVLVEIPEHKLLRLEGTVLVPIAEVQPAKPKPILKPKYNKHVEFGFNYWSDLREAETEKPILIKKTIIEQPPKIWSSSISAILELVDPPLFQHAGFLVLEDIQETITKNKKILVKELKKTSNQYINKIIQDKLTILQMYEINNMLKKNKIKLLK